jgi:hypothetical protein
VYNELVKLAEDTSRLLLTICEKVLKKKNEIRQENAMLSSRIYNKYKESRTY